MLRFRSPRRRRSIRPCPLSRCRPVQRRRQLLLRPLSRCPPPSPRLRPDPCPLPRCQRPWERSGGALAPAVRSVPGQRFPSPGERFGGARNPIARSAPGQRAQGADLPARPRRPPVVRATTRSKRLAPGQPALVPATLPGARTTSASTKIFARPSQPAVALWPPRHSRLNRPLPRRRPLWAPSPQRPRSGLWTNTPGLSRLRSPRRLKCHRSIFRNTVRTFWTRLFEPWTPLQPRVAPRRSPFPSMSPTRNLQLPSTLWIGSKQALQR